MNGCAEPGGIPDQSWWARSKKERLRRAFRYLNSYGMAGGLSLMRRTLQPFGKLVGVDLPGGKGKFFLRSGTSDVCSFETVFLKRDYDGPLPVQPRLIVDAGANIGSASVFFALKYPEARIVALEPSAANFKLLERNVNPYPNITPLHGALWSKRTLLDLSCPMERDDAFVVSEGGGSGTQVPAYTVPDILEITESPQIDLLKIDIEGSEKDVFGAGSENWLPRVRVIMIELHDRMQPGCSSAFYRALSAFEFTQELNGECVCVYK